MYAASSYVLLCKQPQQNYFFLLLYTGYNPGGNNAHLAPEILNAKPGPKRFINYTKQPVWAAGVLAYELAGETCISAYI